MANIKFQKLTPETDADIKVYDEAFGFVFKNDDIRNIAISGSYGSGKSSIIESYKKSHIDCKFSTISLTHFNYYKKSNDVKGKTSEEQTILDNNNLIEGKIVNQIIQQLNPSEIDKSIFKIKTDCLKEDSVIRNYSLVILLFILSFIGLMQPDLFKAIFRNSYLSVLVILFLFFVITLFLIIYFFVKLQVNRNIFKKISIRGNDIELLSESTSYFDKYLNEILYLFEKNKSDNYIFEDIDRFEDVEIFEQLRELNKIINLRLNNKNHRTIRFFYLVRGDLLDAKDNTKFFDFEIPVIPVMNNSNSFNKIKDLMVESGLEPKMNVNFLRRACLYIDDLRLLKNIFNDFLIYINRLDPANNLESNLNLDYNKLFAMMIYKNTYPKDFTDLHFNEGYVYKLFQCRNQWVDKQLDDISNKESLGNIGVEEAKSEKIKCKNTKYIELTNRFDFRNLINEKTSKYENIKKSYYFDLLSYLISSGYIDENYYDYISYFYPNDITNNDKKFLRSLTDSTVLEESYSLDNPKLIMEFLDIADFDKKEILNLDLLKHVSMIDSNHFNTAFELLKRENNPIFLISLLEHGVNKERLISAITKSWPLCVKEIIEDSSLLENRRKCFILTLLSVDGNEHVLELNKDECLFKYLNITNNFYIDIKDEYNIDKIGKALSKLNVKITQISFDKINEALSSFIYKNHLYAINYSNVESAFNTYYTNNSGLNCLTDIYAENQPLATYVDANINTVINLFKDNNMSFEDNEEIAIKILNHAEINSDTRTYYAENIKTKIQDIGKIKSDDVWEYLISNKCIEYTIHNVMLYIKEKGLDDVISTFINSSDKVIKVDDTLTNEEKKVLLNDLINNNIISLKKFDEFMDSIGLKYIVFSTTDVNYEKINSLINNKIIKMNKDNLIFLRDNYDEFIVLQFVDKNIEDYIDLIDSIDSNEIETEHILKSDIELDLKIEFIKNLNEKIYVLNKDYCTEIVKNVIESGDYLDSDEEVEILENYSKYQEYKESIFLHAKKNISDIISNEFKLDTELRNQLIKSDISESSKKSLLIQSIYEDSLDDIKNNFVNINYVEYLKLFEKYRIPKIKVNPVSQEILLALSKRKYINSFSKQDDCYRISKNPKYVK